MSKFKTIIRDTSILDLNSELEHLHTFENVPASMACTLQDSSKDVTMNQVWEICKDTGLVQLRELFPLDVVYKFPHNDGVGKVWENHDKALSEFIESLEVNTALEIGA